jgi:copper transport protein
VNDAIATALAQETLAPGRAGSNSVQVRLRSADGSAFDAQAVGVEISNPAAEMEALQRNLERIERGRFVLGRVELPLAGRWVLKLRARVDDFEYRLGEAIVDLD